MTIPKVKAWDTIHNVMCEVESLNFNGDDDDVEVYIKLSFDNITIDKSNVFRVSLAMWLLKTVANKKGGILKIGADSLIFDNIRLSLNSIFPWRRTMAGLMHDMAFVCPKTDKTHPIPIGEVTEHYYCPDCGIKLDNFTWKP